MRKNNEMENLQWICRDCHKIKTRKERSKEGLYDTYHKLAKKVPWSKK